MMTHPPDIDPAIRPLVEAFNRAGIETASSCQGGEGHAADLPRITFNTQHSAESRFWDVLEFCQSRGLKGTVSMCHLTPDADCGSVPREYVMLELHEPLEGAE